MNKKVYYIIGALAVLVVAILIFTVSCGSKNPIVGTWEYAAEEGQETDTLVFKENGEFELKVANKSIPGAYEANNGVLTIELSKTYEIDENGVNIKEINEPIRYTWSYTIEEDKLILTYEDGAQGIYQRVE